MNKILSPLDHLTIIPSDYEKSLSFYDAALAPLGIKRVMPKDDSCGFGIDRPFFWLGAPDEDHPASRNIHVAFSAASKEEVDAFYAAALKAGGTDHGAPGYRTQYHAGYYAAFVLDLDGNNIEALYRADSSSLQLAEHYLGKEVEVVMDRSLGSKHPKHGFIYEANYGYIEGVKAPDGEDLDAYYLGVNEPLKKAKGVCIAIAHRKDNDDDKLIVVPQGVSMTNEQIMSAIHFQEQWFDTEIIVA